MMNNSPRGEVIEPQQIKTLADGEPSDSIVEFYQPASSETVNVNLPAQFNSRHAALTPKIGNEPPMIVGSQEWANALADLEHEAGDRTYSQSPTY